MLSISVLSGTVSVSEQAQSELWSLSAPLKDTQKDSCSTPLVTRAVSQLLPLLPDTSQLISCISRYTCQVSQLGGQRQSYTEEAHIFTGCRHDRLASQAECSLVDREGSNMAIPPSSRWTNTQHCPTGQWDQDGHPS